MFPVYVFEKDDGSVFEFPTLNAIQQHLEAIDVENVSTKLGMPTGAASSLVSVGRNLSGGRLSRRIAKRLKPSLQP